MATKEYTCDLSTNVGKVRLMIGDDDQSDPWLFDDQISALISIYNSDINLACAAACRRIASLAAQQSKKMIWENGALVADGTQTPMAWISLAKTFEELGASRPYSATQELEDETQEVRDADKGKWDHDFTDAPSDS